VGIEHLFSGNALGAVDAAGRVRLPRFVLETLERRSGGRRIVFGAHERDPCLSGYEPAFRAVLQSRLAAGDPAMARRLFGFAEEAEFDARGRVALPEMMRRRGGIGALALFVGTGGAFEIWSPERALAGDPELREIAGYRLDQFHSEREEA
jgi:MraZ protein